MKCRSYPPMPIESDFKNDISTFDVGQIYKDQKGNNLSVISVFLLNCGNNITGTVKFRNNQNQVIKKDATQLKKLYLKRIF